MSVLTLKISVYGNKNGYYVDEAEMADHVMGWIDGALSDRDDLDGWAIEVEEAKDLTPAGSVLQLDTSARQTNTEDDHAQSGVR